MNICIECRRLIKLWFLFALVLYTIIFGYNIPVALIFLLSFIILFLSIGFWGGIIEVFTIFLSVIVLSFFTDNIFLIYLIPMTNILLFMAFRSGRLMAALISYGFILLWCYLSIPVKFTLLNYIVIFICLVNLLIHIKGLFIKKKEEISWSYIVEKNDNVMDNILWKLKEGLYDIKGSIDYVEDISKINNNIVIYTHTKFSSISIAYLKYLYKTLPKGNGKKAFIIYSATFFPEMAYIPLWILLTLKGYQVMGRSYYIYSLAEIKFANIYYAADKDMMENIRKGIYDISDGFQSAMPLYFHLVPLAFFSYLFRIIFSGKNKLS